MTTHSPPIDLTGRSLLAVFAHPDDESLASGGLLACCAHLGATVTLLCATRGEHGQGEGDLGTIRADELRAAAHVLGIDAPVILGYEDGMLPWADRARLQSDIVKTIIRRRPEVVVTFDEDGLYGHPDHIAIHEDVTAAVASLNGATPALYYVTMPAGRMRAVVEHAAMAVPSSAGRPLQAILGIDDPDAFGAIAPPPSLILDVGPYTARKLAALECHASQMHGCALLAVSDRDAARFLGTEHYRRADVGSRNDAFIEHLTTRHTPIDA